MALEIVYGEGQTPISEEERRRIKSLLRQLFETKLSQSCTWCGVLDEEQAKEWQRARMMLLTGNPNRRSRRSNQRPKRAKEEHRARGARKKPTRG